MKPARERCKDCGGYGYLYAHEINGCTLLPFDKVPCRKCRRLRWAYKFYLWFVGYKSNKQLRDHTEIIAYFTKLKQQTTKKPSFDSYLDSLGPSQVRDE